MNFGAFFEILAAFFAVLGIVFCIKLVLNRLFMPKNIVLSAKIFDAEAAENVDILIKILKDESMARSICLLINEQMANDDAFMESVYYSGVMFYIVKD